MEAVVAGVGGGVAVRSTITSWLKLSGARGIGAKSAAVAARAAAAEAAVINLTNDLFISGKTYAEPHKGQAAISHSFSVS
jgi:hypothetical protein